LIKTSTESYSKHLEQQLEFLRIRIDKKKGTKTSKKHREI